GAAGRQLPLLPGDRPRALRSVPGVLGAPRRTADLRLPALADTARGWQGRPVSRAHEVRASAGGGRDGLGGRRRAGRARGHRRSRGRSALPAGRARVGRPELPVLPRDRTPALRWLPWLLGVS